MLQPFVDALIPFMPGYLELPESYVGLIKGASHRYIKRVPKAGGGYRYFYHVGHGGGVNAEDHFVPGASFRHDGGHYHIKSEEGGKLTIEHDETKERKTVSKSELRTMLGAHHEPAIKAHREKVAGMLAEARANKASPKQIARLEARAKVAGVSDKAHSERERAWISHLRQLADKHGKASSRAKTSDASRKQSGLASFYDWTADHFEGKTKEPPKPGHRLGMVITGPSSAEAKAVPDERKTLTADEFAEAKRGLTKLGDPAKFATDSEQAEAHVAQREAKEKRDREARMAARTAEIKALEASERERKKRDWMGP